MSALSQPKAIESKIEAQSQSETCLCAHKNKPRSQELKSSVSRRINRVIGQLGGIKILVEDDRY